MEVANKNILLKILTTVFIALEKTNVYSQRVLEKISITNRHQKYHQVFSKFASTVM